MKIRYFYYNNKGERRGEFSGKEIKAFVKAGLISQDTIIETDDGNKFKANSIKNATFNSAKFSDNHDDATVPKINIKERILIISVIGFFVVYLILGITWLSGTGERVRSRKNAEQTQVEHKNEITAIRKVHQEEINKLKTDVKNTGSTLDKTVANNKELQNEINQLRDENNSLQQLVVDEKKRANQAENKLKQTEQIQNAKTQEKKNEKWYEGGTLHRSTVADWKNAKYENKLATAADWCSSLLEKIGKQPENLDEIRWVAEKLVAACDKSIQDIPKELEKQLISDVALVQLNVNDALMSPKKGKPINENTDRFEHGFPKNQNISVRQPGEPRVPSPEFWSARLDETKKSLNNENINSNGDYRTQRWIDAERRLSELENDISTSRRTGYAQGALKSEQEYKETLNVIREEIYGVQMTISVGEWNRAKKSDKLELAACWVVTFHGIHFNQTLRDPNIISSLSERMVRACDQATRGLPRELQIERMWDIAEKIFLSR